MTTNALPSPEASASVLTSPNGNPLLDLAETLPAVFGPNHPSPRWFESQVKRGIIPVHKIGRLCRYDPRLVRAALDLHCLVEGKKNRNLRKGGA